MILKNGLEVPIRNIELDSEYTEEHMHHIVRWCGKKSPQGANDWYAPMSSGLANPYIVTSGNNTWGAEEGDEAKLFGTTDLPISGMVYGDFDKILVIANTSSTVYLCRLIWGTGTMADAITAGQYSEFPYLRGNADNNRKIQEFKTPKLGSDVAVWMQCMNASDNATMSFFLGVQWI